MSRQSEVLDPHTSGLVGASGQARVRREWPVDEFPGDTTGGRELAADADLADAVGVVRPIHRWCLPERSTLASKRALSCGMPCSPQTSRKV
jgi:hypothetical protein